MAKVTPATRSKTEPLPDRLRRRLTPAELAAINARRLTPREWDELATQHDDLPEVNSLAEIPEFASEREEAEFWATHSFGPGLLQGARSLTPEEREAHGLPPTRARPRPTETQPVSIRLERDALRRLRTLAAKRGTRYQTLLKQFVYERLYEEEKRERLVS